MRERLRTIWDDDRGATMVEYAILVAGIGVALILVLNVISGSLSGLFDSVRAGFES